MKGFGPLAESSWGRVFSGHGSCWNSAVVLSAWSSRLLKLPIVLIDLPVLVIETSRVLKYVYTCQWIS